MSATVVWRCAKPTCGLRDAMLRIAAQIADEGDYNEVDILSTPKSMSGGRKTSTHFKVNLKGRDNDRNVIHEYLIKIEHRDSNGDTWRYQTNNRPANYDYSTLKAKNGPPSGCPRNKRAQRDREVAESASQAVEQAQSSQYYSAVDQGALAPSGGRGEYGSGGFQLGEWSSQSNNSGYNSSTQPAGNAQSWPDGWYNDPWAKEIGKLRWLENGVWTGHTS